MDTSASDRDGQGLAPRRQEINNNVCGILHESPDPAHVAGAFERAGWAIRTASWYFYELETNWCQVEVEQADDTTLLNGVIDPQRLDDLAALLGRLGLRYMIELYDDSNRLISELQG
ncbi:hypothetical protein ACIQFZ_33615 [Streptomyces sp. NPDC093064]|uniref:hypothetical protein n=1 Tax=unclassified Streptomyces TaxID=2593676 RepID=UPI0034289AF0